jgi:hypothetical protein
MDLLGFLRKAKTGVPKGEYYSPTFKFRTDNAGHGYQSHIHLYKRDVLTNIVFTRQDNKVYAYKHAEGKCGLKLSLSDVKKDRFKKQLIKDGLLVEIMKPNKWIVLFSKEKVHLFNVKAAILEPVT